MSDLQPIRLASGQTVILRRGRIADAPTLCEFNACLARETEGLQLDPAVLRRGVDAALEDSRKALYWVAEHDGAVVGQLMITWEWSDWRNGVFWWIQSVYVRSDWRARGVFKALFEFVRDQARQQGDVCGIRLYVEEENAKAREAYARLGLQTTHYQLLEQDFRLRR